VTTVLVQGREPSVISDYCREKSGCVLGRGIRELGGPRVLCAIELGLEALSIPHGRGELQAAVEYRGRGVRP